MIYYLLYLFLIFNQPIENKGCLKIDIMLVGDFSASVGGYEDFVADAFDAFINRFELNEYGIRIGGVIFSDNVIKLSELTHNKSQLISAVDQMRNTSMAKSTNLIQALSIVYKEFKNNGRADVNKMIIIISDGDVMFKQASKDFINVLKTRDNINICGIYIDGPYGIESYMIDISSDNCYVASSYSVLVQTLSELDICL